MYDNWAVTLIRNQNGWTVAVGSPNSMKDYYVFEGWDKTEAFVLAALRGRRDALLSEVPIKPVTV